MKIEIKRPVDHRIAPARILGFKPGFVDAPKKIAEALIAQGAAIPAKPQPAKEE